MSEVITGDASQVSNSLQRVVSGATNASPIVITTSTSHLFATGDTVVVDSVGGNTAANGEWLITVTGPSTFELDGSTGNGSYTSGGTAADVSLTPQFTAPEDGDLLDAASVRVAIDTLADRSQFLNLVSRGLNTRLEVAEGALSLLSALNFQIKTTSLGTLRGAGYDSYSGRWYVVGDTENVRVSTDNCLSFTATVIDAIFSNEHCHFIDFDNVGNAVVSTETRYIAELTYATSTWTKVDVKGSALGSAIPCPVVYDPVHAKWIWLTDTLVATSTNRTSWTVDDLDEAPLFNDNLTLHRMACNRATGRVVASGVQTGGSLDLVVISSDDGGETWTDRASLNTAIASPTVSSLVYHPARDEWLITLGETSGAASGEVWRSVDGGESWTLATSLSATTIVHPAPHEDLWVAGARGTRSEIVVSDDGGASWRRIRHVTDATLIGCYAAPGGLIALTTGSAWPSLRSGEAFEAVT